MTERIHIHRVEVQGAGDTAAFEAALPCQLKEVTGLAFVAVPATAHMTALMGMGWKLSSAGGIAFRHPAPGDTFLQAPVPLALPMEQGYEPLGVAHPAGKAMGGGEPWITGGHILQWHGVRPGGEGRTLKGLFPDTLNGLTGQDASYAVEIFIRYAA